MSRRRSTFKNVKLIDLEPKKLKGNVLPTKADILRAIAIERAQTDKYNYKDAISKVAAEVKSIWTKASITSISLKRIVFLILKYNKEFIALSQKSGRDRQTTKAHIKKVKLFQVCL